MKFSRSTIDAFRWCGKLNPGLVLYPGKTIRTITHNKAVILKVLVEDQFPMPNKTATCEEGQLPPLCALESLDAFLRDLDVETDVNFGHEDYILLSKGRTTTKVPKGDPRMVMTPPNKELRIANFQETVFLHADDLEQMPLAKRSRSSKANKSGSKKTSEYIFAFHAEKEGAPIMLDIIKDDVIRTISLKVPRPANQPFLVRIKQRNLVLLPGSYEVEFSKVGVSRWRGVNVAASVWIAIESKQGWFGAQERDEGLERARLYKENAAKTDLAKQQERQLINETDEQAKTSVAVKAA